MNRTTEAVPWRQTHQTLCELFESTVVAHGEQTFIKAADQTLTYQQAFNVVEHLASRWAPEISDTDVAVLLPNSAAFIISYLAALRAGARPALINIAMPEAAVTRLLADLDPSRVLAAQPVSATQCLEIHDDKVWALRDSLDNVSVSPASAGGHEVAAILFTGGTTGMPKRVRHTHAAMIAKVERMEWGWPTRVNEVWLPIAPFTHIYGYLMGVANPMLKGATLVIPARFQPDLIIDLLASEQVSVFGGGPPAIYQALMAAQDFEQADLSHLRVCPGGGASFPEALLRQWNEQTGLNIYEGIGMTEIAPIAVNTEHSGARAGTVGTACPDTVVEIVDLDTGTRVLDSGEIGEIRVKGPHMMREYDNNPEETAIAMRNGFIYTGDIGMCDDDGFLHVTDRKKDVIFSKGFNVFPREVEETLMGHDAVVQAAVVGKAHDRAGEVPVAFVKVTGQKTDQDQLLQHCREQLIDYKVPQHIVLLDDLPLTPARKVDRTALRQQATDL